MVRFIRKFRLDISEATYLTPREREVLVEVAKGATAKRVAYSLGISVQTVKNHMSKIYEKLDTDNVIGAFTTLGWLKVPEE